MKITFILPGRAERPSGGYRVVYEYANALVGRGHEVTVIHPRSLFLSGPPLPLFGRLKRELRELARLVLRGLKTIDISVPWQSMDRRVRMLSVPLAWSTFVPKGDAVFATLWRTAELVASFPENRGRGFYLIQHHELWDGPSSRVNATWKLPLRKVIISRWLQALGESLGATDMTYIPNAIDHENFFVTQEIGSRPQRVSMLYSRHKWKGAREGIEALQKLKKEFPKLEAVLFGIQPRPLDLPDWIDYSENPEQGFLRDEIYNKSSIYLCPSWSEGWGLPITESMACGCAIVSADNGGVHEFVVDGVSGVIRQSRSAPALADGLRALLGNDQRRKSMAFAGLVSVRSFEYSRSINELERLLSERDI